MRAKRISLVLVLGAFCWTLTARADTFSFMPPGGRTIFLTLADRTDPTALAEVAGRKATAKEWQAWASERDPAIDAQRLSTFAGYAELNFPLGAADLATLAGGTSTSVLPRDGKDLAVAECQGCHTLFADYLLIDRSESRWQRILQSSLHADIKLTDIEKATLARYSALNMPIPVERVPENLRF